MLDRRLLYFVEIVDRGGFRRASETLHITQPALTKAIRSLEAELGTLLFQRHAGGVTPTSAGQVLAHRARGMLAESRSARAEVEAVTQGRSHLLRIGAGAGWATQVLPPAIARLRRHQPALRVALRTGPTSDLHAALMADDLDLCFGALGPLDGVPAIRRHPLRTVSNALFVRPGHPLARRDGPVGVADAIPYPWIMLEHDNLVRQEVAARTSEAGGPPFEPTIACGSVMACMNLAVLDDSVLCLSELLAAEATRHGLVVLPVRLTPFMLGAWHGSSVAAAKQRWIDALIDDTRQDPARHL